VWSVRSRENGFADTPLALAEGRESDYAGGKAVWQQRREGVRFLRGRVTYTLRTMRQSDSHRETEVKLMVLDLRDLVGKLKRLGARPRGRVLERNVLFDTDTHDMRKRGRLLRLRTEEPAPSEFAPGGAARRMLTAKAPVPESGRASRRVSRRNSRYKMNIEREVVIKNAAPRPAGKRRLRDRGWTFALGFLGFRTSFRYEKYRTSFEFKGVHVSLDETPVGVFLELEGEPEAIDRVAHELGFTPRDYIRATYYEIYAAEQRRRGRPVRNMVFPSKNPAKIAVSA